MWRICPQYYLRTLTEYHNFLQKSTLILTYVLYLYTIRGLALWGGSDGIIYKRGDYYLEKEVKIQENKMGVMPVAKLLLTMSVPMMISMLVQALYNIVDSMFVAKLSENALTAVSLAFPVQNLMIAVGTGTGVGINALVSRSLGEKKREYANSAANNGIYLAIFSFIGSQLCVDYLRQHFLKCRPRIRRSSNTVSIM